MKNVRILCNNSCFFDINCANFLEFVYIKKTMNIKGKGEDMDDLYVLQLLQTTLSYYRGNPLHISMICYIWNIIEC